MLLIGFLLGLLVGGLLALFKPARSSTHREFFDEAAQRRHDSRETAERADPAAESLEQGRAAAQRRRAELGFKRNNQSR
jgi:hypothetical protein